MANAGNLDRDPMTDLYNKSSFKRLLKDTILQSQPFALAIADIDKLRRFVDDHGYFYGDEAILHAARSLRRGMPDRFPVARIGGDEFAILAPTTSKDELLDHAESARLKISMPVTFQHPGHQPGLYTVTISIGIAAWPADGTDEEQLVNRAENALLCAKQSGRNRVIVIGSQT